MIPFAVLALLLQAQPAATPSPAVPSPAAPSPAAASPKAPAPKAPSPAAAPSPMVVRPSVEPPTPPPVPEVVLGLVRKTTAFSAESGRTALRATPTAPARIPGIDDKGYFVEIQWTDKAGAAQSGVAVLAHATVLEVPWIVKPEGAEEWGLVQVMEGKSVPTLVDELKRTRIAANEAMAVTDLRTLMTAETLFMSLTMGSYGEYRCLHRPADCIKDIPEEPMLDKSYLAIERNGYRRKFHAGEKVTDNPRGKGIPYLKTYAFTTVPIVPGETGVRSFCGDHTGRVCVITDGSQPAVTGGSCANPCTELKSEQKPEQK